MAPCSSSPLSPPATNNCPGHGPVPSPSIPLVTVPSSHRASPIHGPLWPLSTPRPQAETGCSPRSGDTLQLAQPRPQGTPGAGWRGRCRVRQAACRGVPRARHELAEPARPAPGLPCGLPAPSLCGTGCHHRAQGREWDAPRLGTASQWAPCCWGWKQLAVPAVAPSHCKPVTPGWDAEGCAVGSRGSGPAHRGHTAGTGRGLGCAPVGEGAGCSPRSSRCCTDGCPWLSTLLPLQGHHPAVRR